jgi:hypothetical protein
VPEKDNRRLVTDRDHEEFAYAFVALFASALITISVVRAWQPIEKVVQDQVAKPVAPLLTTPAHADWPNRCDAIEWKANPKYCQSRKIAPPPKTDGRYPWQDIRPWQVIRPQSIPTEPLYVFPTEKNK